MTCWLSVKAPLYFYCSALNTPKVHALSASLLPSISFQFPRFLLIPQGQVVTVQRAQISLMELPGHDNTHHQGWYPKHNLCNTGTDQKGCWCSCRHSQMGVFLADGYLPGSATLKPHVPRTLGKEICQHTRVPYVFRYLRTQRIPRWNGPPGAGSLYPSTKERLCGSAGSYMLRVMGSERPLPRFLVKKT